MTVFSLHVQDQAVYLPASLLSQTQEQKLFSEMLRRNTFCNCQDIPIREPHRLSSMKARRMSRGTRLACEAALHIASRFSIDAWIFASQHGETSRGIKIMDRLIENETVSPTDFMMSVHNAAAGVFTVESRFHGTVTSLAAGGDTFHMALIEAASMLGTDMRRVAIVEFDDVIDLKLSEAFKVKSQNMTYATTWVLEQGVTQTLSIETKASLSEGIFDIASVRAISLLAEGYAKFETVGENTICRWESKA